MDVNQLSKANTEQEGRRGKRAQEDFEIGIGYRLSG